MPFWMGQWPDSRSLANYPKCEISVAIGPHILSSHGQGVQTIQQGIPSGCSNGQIAAARAECQAVHIAQWAAGCGPILEHCEARQVHQTQRILSNAARHCQDLHAALSPSLSSSKTKTHWIQNSSRELPHAVETEVSGGITFTQLTCLPAQQICLNAALEASETIGKTRAAHSRLAQHHHS